MLEQFKNPPAEYGEVSFYWWVGEKLEKDRLLWQLERLRERGICALQINYCHSDEGGKNYGLTMDSDPPLFSEDWWELVGWFMEECKKYGIAVALSDYTIAPPGQDRYMDTILAKHPEVIGKKLVLEDGEVVIKEIPLSIDPMHPKLGAYVIEEFYGKFDEHFPGEGGKGLNFFFSDELVFNVRGNLWNDRFAAEFLRRKGYDIWENRQAIFEDVGEKTEKIRLDYYDVIVQLCEEGYFIPVYNWNEERGMTFGCDHGGRGRDITEFGDYFRTQRWTQGPGNDQPNLASDIIKAKVSSSISHMYNRPRCWLEGFYGSGWGTSTGQLADAVYRNFALGHNLLTLHGLYYTTYGGYWEWAPPCNHFRMPYWKHMDKFLSCSKRLSYLLTRGHHVCDVAILYPVAALEGGDSGQTAVEAAFSAGEFLYTNTVDFDFIDFESINRATAADGLFSASGEQYKVVVVPSMKTIRYTNLEKLHAFSKQGGKVFFLGELPIASDRVGRTDPILDELVQEIVTSRAILTNKDFICQNCSNGNPQTKEQLLTLIQEIGVSDIRGEENPFVLHRRTDGIDIYFVYGAKKGSEYFFRAKGSIVLYDPWTGEERPLACIKQDDTGSYLRMPLSENEVQLLAFDNQGAAQLEKSFPTAKLQPIAGSWRFTLLPTMDNQYGDYSQPPTQSVIGAQARFFRFSQGEVQKEVMCGFATHFYKLGGLPAPCDAEILNCEKLTEAEITQNGSRFAFLPYDFSMRVGVWMDPGRQHSYHGLKGKITDEFLTMGKKVVTYANSSSRYDPEESGNITYFYTAVRCETEGEYFVKTGSLKPAKIYLDQQEVTQPKLSLTAGVHEILLRFDQNGRSYFILDKAEETQPQTYPLAMHWYQNPTVLPFCPRYRDMEKPCSFCFTAPPGLSTLRFSAKGTVTVSVDGLPLSLEQAGEEYCGVLPAPSPNCREITIEIQPVFGYFESAIPQAVDLTCVTGEMLPGDWGKIEGLRCYSGGARYSKEIALPKAEKIFLDLGEVGCSAEVFVNGCSAGVRMHKPYRFDITALAREGGNILAMEIYNTLYNHYLTIPSGYNTTHQPSGLLGEVTLEIYERRE